MSDTIISLNYKSAPVKIKYSKNYYGFSDSNNNTNKYLFELIIYVNDNILISPKNINVNQSDFYRDNKSTDDKIKTKYFRNLEELKYSHLIKLNHKIKLDDITNYKASVTIIRPEENDSSFELEGVINHNQSSSTQSNNNLYIEFTQNDNGYAICSCFYTGMDYNKIFASPPI
jgi:hypothetical protein